MTSVIGGILVVQQFNNTQTLTSAKFNEICRCCLSEGQMYPIFEMDYKGLMFVDLLKICASVELDKNDSLPQNLCTTCVKKVIDLHGFKEQCRTSEAILKDVVRKERLDCLENISTTIKNEVITLDESDCEEIVLEVEKNFESDIQETNDYTNLESQVLETSDEILIETESIETNEKNTFMETDSLETSEDTHSDSGCLETNDNTHGESDISVTNESPERSLEKKPRVRKKGACVQGQQTRTKYTCGLCKKPFFGGPSCGEYRVKEKRPQEKLSKKLHLTLCEICGKFIIQFEQHMQMHNGLNLFECKVCFKQFGKKHDVKKHMITHSKERPYKCEICERGFFSFSSLKQHVYRHRGRATDFVCSRCGEKYPTAGELQRHIDVTHLGITPSNDSEDKRCNICDRDFQTRIAFYAHMQQRHDKKRFLCSTCGRGFSSLITLQNHEVIHSDARPHTCEFCGRSFKLLQTLKTHMMQHTGEKPFSCDVCHKKFRQMNQRKIHMRMHTGVRPYQCKICGKAFSMKGNLDVHFRIHTGEKPFVCDVCGKGFNHLTAKKKHRQTHRDKNDL